MTHNSVARPAFCLDRDPWIPSLYDDGSLRDVSLRTLFADAHRICDIVPNMPQQKLPILRLALAILYRAYVFPEDQGESEMLASWGVLWDEGRFDPAETDAYFDYVPDAFDLFHPERPFFQVAGLSYTGGADRAYDPVSEIIADVPKPKKFLHSMRARNALGDISFAEAARWLVFMQAYDSAGIKTPVVGNTFVNKGKVYPPKDSVGTGWMGAIGGVFLRGTNLFETLMLNWVIYDSRTEGRSYFDERDNLPPWEREPRPEPSNIYESYATGEEPGIVELYTWQSRRVRLVPNEAATAVTGVVACYGDILRPAEHQGSEPMTCWNANKSQQKKFGLSYPPLTPVRPVAGRSLWRGFASLLALDEDGADRRPGVVRWLGQIKECELGRPLPPLAVCAQGITYGTQSSFIEDAVDDSFDLGAALRDAVSGSVDQTVKTIAATEEGVRALVAFARSVDEIAGNRHADSGSDAVREQAYGKLDELFRQRIAQFSEDDDPLAYGAAWRRETHKKLLDLASEYVALAGVSRFSSHGVARDGRRPATVSEAMGLYKNRLAKILGPLRPPVGQDAAPMCEEGR